MTEPAASDTFVANFRASAPYIHAHRGRTFVVVVGGEAFGAPGLRPMLHDVALLLSLGVRVVLVAGARPQIDAGIARRGHRSHYAGGLRVTDEIALECVKEAAGTNRVELEALLSMGLPSSPMAGASVRVAAGNFVTARPIGVVDGVDFQHSGKVRRVDAEGIRQRLDSGALVVLTPIGYSATGEVFNLSTPELAAETAVALAADKLICLTEGERLQDDAGAALTELSPAEAEALIESGRPFATDVARHLAAAVQACRAGVGRAHLVPRSADGGLLRELFTRDGLGTLVTSTRFEGMRAARREDIAGILTLIEPLEREGVLVRRSRQMLEHDVDRFTVIERDGAIVGCAAVYPYAEERIAELACVVVDRAYRRGGRGDELLAYVERRCRADGLERIFVLTTQTSHWFIERGFAPCTLDALPEARRKAYDVARRSKLLLKQL
ncbi:MAG: amino-acid N-acetyltransferase [Myxococcales bacterium]|nr:amino-acid N-acetyltransferase [Myxococcales bacterium]